MHRWLLRLVVFIALTGLSARAAEPVTPAPSAEVPPLLMDALEKVAMNFDRWAYTETQMMTDEHGVPQPETVIRFDPSKPYAEQYQVLKFKGKPPTEKAIKEFRKRGEKRGEKFAKQEAEGKAPGSELPRFKMGGSTASIDLVHATVVSENADSVTFEVPLRNDGHGTLPVEKFQLFARVNRATHAFENVSLKVRSAFRVKLVMKVKSGEGSIDFATVAPEHDPLPVRMSGDATASILFVKFGGGFEAKRVDFVRVKPYGERFGVKIGPLKALDF
jgi:hypothetical protein